MGFQEGVNGIVGILEVGQLARAGRTRLAAGGSQVLGDPVIAERAFVRDLFFVMDVAAAVRAGLHAIGAAQAVGLVDQDDAIRSDEGGPDRANLGAGRIGAVVAHFGNEEILARIFGDGRESFLPPSGEMTSGLVMSWSVTW